MLLSVRTTCKDLGLATLLLNLPGFPLKFQWKSSWSHNCGVSHAYKSIFTRTGSVAVVWAYLNHGFISYPESCELSKGSWLPGKQFSRSVLEIVRAISFPNDSSLECFENSFIPSLSPNALPDYWGTLRHSYCPGLALGLLLPVVTSPSLAMPFLAVLFWPNCRFFQYFLLVLIFEVLFSLYIFLKSPSNTCTSARMLRCLDIFSSPFKLHLFCSLESETKCSKVLLCSNHNV